MSIVPGQPAASGLLAPDEPPAFEVLNADGAGSAVLVCDHASNRVPRRLGTLGLAPPRLADHIGWDPGAAEVVRRLAVELDAPAVLSGYSRLVIDCNRPLADAASIPEQSAGVVVPGNLGLTDGERAARVEALFRPYHAAIDRLLDSRADRPTLLLSIHSFTPVLAGRERPWPVGVSHWHDRRFAALLSRALTPRVSGIVGDNQPYPIDALVDYTVPVHGEGRRLHAVMIEIRNDGLRTTAQTDAWAERLAAAYREIQAEAVSLGRPPVNPRPTPSVGAADSRSGPGPGSSA